MELKNVLMDEMKSAMKDKDTVKKDTVQLVRAAILQYEKDNKVVLDDDGVVEIIAKEVKDIKTVDRTLTLDGLKIIYELNK